MAPGAPMAAIEGGDALSTEHTRSNDVVGPPGEVTAGEAVRVHPHLGPHLCATTV